MTCLASDNEINVEDATRRAPQKATMDGDNSYSVIIACMSSAMENVDPVNLDPVPPLLDSYSFHSTLPPSAARDSAENKEGWMMGIDEAGRGRE